MQDLHVKLHPGFPWQNQRSKRKKIPSPASWTYFKYEADKMLYKLED
jgi:hypothetical protein